MIQDTSTYHIAYILATTIYVAYVVSLWWRARKARQRIDDLRRGAR